MARSRRSSKFESRPMGRRLRWSSAELQRARPHACELLRHDRSGSRDNHGQRVDRAVRLAFLEITFYLRHLIGDVGETKDHSLPRLARRHKARRPLSRRREPCCLHGSNSRGRLTKGRVRRPRRTAHYRHAEPVECPLQRCKELGWVLAAFGRRQIVIARALVPERTLDQDNVCMAVIATPPTAPTTFILMSKRKPDTNNCSAMRTANEAPTAQGTIPSSISSCVSR